MYVCMYIFYLHAFEPIYIYTFVSILVYVRIYVAKPRLRTNHVLSLTLICV